MEQVKRYCVFEWSMTGDLEERDPQQLEVVLATDHARCVQDVRKLARMVQVLCRRDEDKPDWEIAQAVLDRWPGVQE